MRPHTSLTLLITTVLLLAGCLGAAPAGTTPASTTDDVTITHHRVATVDDVEIAITVFRPPNVSEEDPVPVVLHSHGWSGSRATNVSGIVADLTKAGYGVVSVDARGHGESGGVATVHNRDYEVRDFRVLLDWIHDNLGWVQRDTTSGIPKDVVAGATGGSYGGGYQLMTASADDRLDALAPEITWHDLTYSLAPHGVVKSVWVDALYGAAKASGTRIHEDIDRWYAEAMLTNAFPEDAFEHFKASSPEPAEIEADVLLVQGIPDVLFNLNEAWWTYEALAQRAEGEVRLVTHLGGHVLPGVQPLGFAGERGTSPCGDVDALVVAWFDAHLRGEDVPDVPAVSLALENGECVTLDALPEDTEVVNLGTPLVAPQGAGTLMIPVMDGPAVVAGLPRLEAGTLAAPGTEVLLHAGLVVVDADGRARVVDDQTTGIRVAPGDAIDVTLAGVATRLGEGDRLFLRVDGLNEWFATNGNRAPGGAVLTDVTLTVPVVPDA